MKVNSKRNCGMRTYSLIYSEDYIQITKTITNIYRLHNNITLKKRILSTSINETQTRMNTGTDMGEGHDEFRKYKGTRIYIHSCKKVASNSTFIKCIILRRSLFSFIPEYQGCHTI